ncbi:MAG: hypothetical protein N2319_10470 [Candidatus Kapabacteria bacterium]|nr:hypothetical protein [Candidatus Kapabacteria bacterium]
MSIYTRKKYWQKVLIYSDVFLKIFILFSFILQSCSSGIIVSGVVKEWNNASPWIRSDIVKPGELNLPDTLIPVPEAEIIILHSTDFSKADSLADNITVFKTKSDINGKYIIKINPPKDSSTSAIIARKKGYIFGFKNYINFTKIGNYDFDIYLVPERFK